MSEQKYYVKLRKEVMYYSDYGFGSIQYLEPYLNDSGDFASAIDRTSFTKSELSKIMDGALYSVSDEKCNYCRYSGDTCGDEHCEEWINPLIELVPIDEV